jgi:chromosome segregation ATPase
MESDADRRIAALQRVNEELAAELRSLTLGRTGSPRRGSLPASREIARLRGQRDALDAELEETKAQLVEAQAHREGLEQQNRAMAAEIARLSAGLAGVVRRARGKLLSRD